MAKKLLNFQFSIDNCPKMCYNIAKRRKSGKRKTVRNHPVSKQNYGSGVDCRGRADCACAAVLFYASEELSFEAERTLFAQKQKEEKL